MSNHTKLPKNSLETTNVLHPEETATKLRIALPASIDVTHKVRLPEESLRDTVDVNRETPDLLPALLLETEDSPEAWPQMPSLLPESERPTPRASVASEPEVLPVTDVLPLVTLPSAPKQESIPTSVIAARVPREQIPTRVIISRQEPPKKASRLPLLGFGVASGVFLVGLVFSLMAEQPAAVVPAKVVEPKVASVPALSASPTVSKPLAEPNEVKPKKVSLTVFSAPKGAQIFLDGKLLGVTPLIIALDENEQAQLSVSKEGFVMEERRISLRGDAKETFVLEKKQETSKAQTTKTASTPKFRVKKSPGKNDVPTNPFK